MIEKMDDTTKLRAISWWITWNDLMWPDEDVADKMRRRADLMLESGADVAIIFGAHFRWDFMPLWTALHDLLHFCADELHQRGLKLYDHHSSVLTHHFSTVEEMKTIRLEHRHHVPFAPSRDVAETWNYNGFMLEDWGQIDVRTRQKSTVPAYSAKQFCFNNPDFVSSYLKYVKRLVAETGIDGLMSDDAIHYSAFETCACPHCLKEFRESYGHELPPGDDMNFWGNWRNPAFRDWIQMRYSDVGKYLDAIRNVLPKDFPLMACCSNSISAVCNFVGMSYNDFAKGCNAAMLEMCGNTPGEGGKLNTSLASQLHQMAIARTHKMPCVGLGYCFTPPTAELVWAFDKFVGIGTWVSTNKGTLGLPDSALAPLADDPEIPGRAFNYEKKHPELFASASAAEIAVYASDPSLRFNGESPLDYELDFSTTVNTLFQQGFAIDVTTVIPENAERYKVLFVPSMNCMSMDERTALRAYAANGGQVLLTGPAGFYDQRGFESQNPFLKELGLDVEFKEEPREGHFPMRPPYPFVPGECVGVTPQWRELMPGFRHHSQRGAKGLPEGTADLLRSLTDHDLETLEADGWLLRTFFDEKGRLLLHGLAAEYDTVDNPLKAKQKYLYRWVIDEVHPRSAVRTCRFNVCGKYSQAELFLPLDDADGAVTLADGTMTVSLPEKAFYFIIRLA